MGVQNGGIILLVLVHRCTETLPVANIAIVFLTEACPHLFGACVVVLWYPSDELSHRLTLIEEVVRLEDNQLNAKVSMQPVNLPGIRPFDSWIPSPGSCCW
jgi:hypothetical protein